MLRQQIHIHLHYQPNTQIQIQRTPGNQNPLNISSADTDIKFKQSAYGEMTVTSSTVLSG